MSLYRDLVFVYIGLLALLALTVGTSLLNLGPVNALINLGVSLTKAALILWIFMELRNANGLQRVMAVAAFYWLLILLVLGSVNWLTRY